MEAWVSVQNGRGSRKTLDKRKINTMNLAERLTWVRWTEVCPGTNPSRSPARSAGTVAIVSLRSGPLQGDLPTPQQGSCCQKMQRFAAGSVKLFEGNTNEPCWALWSEHKCCRPASAPMSFPPAASDFWVSVVDSFNLRLLLCADLWGTCRCSYSAGPPHTHSLNLALHCCVLEEHV